MAAERTDASSGVGLIWPFYETFSVIGPMATVSMVFAYYKMFHSFFFSYVFELSC